MNHQIFSWFFAVLFKFMVFANFTCQWYPPYTDRKNISDMSFGTQSNGTFVPNSIYWCRSTSATLVDSRSPSRGTYQARRHQTKNSRLKTSYTYITLFSSFVHKWYVVVTYPPHAHICNSCKRFVVVTYRSIMFTPWKSTYSIRVIPVNWSRLGRSNYGTNGYSFNFPIVYLSYY